MNLGELAAKVTLDTSGFDRGVDKVKKQASTIGQTLMHMNQAADLLSRSWRVLDNTAGQLARSFISAADSAERYRLSLNVILGSSKEASRMFDNMAKFAAKVPFEYDEIMSSAVSLSAVMRGGVKEVGEWMPMITDLAAVTRMSVQDVTSNVIRMYSAGASAADGFREKGVLAMMGFKAGVQYTAAETKKLMMEAFESPESKFRGASKALASTWSGLMSNMADQWFLFRMKIMEGGPFESLKKVLRDVLKYLDNLWDTGKMEQYGILIAQWMSKAIDKTWEWIKMDLPQYWDKFKDSAERAWEVTVRIAVTLEKITNLFDTIGKQWDNLAIGFRWLGEAFGYRQIDQPKEGESFSEYSKRIGVRGKAKVNIPKPPVPKERDPLEYFPSEGSRWGEELARKISPEGPTKEAADALKDLQARLAEARVEGKKLSLQNLDGSQSLIALEQAIMGVNFQAQQMREKLKAEIASSPQIGGLIEQIRATEIANLKAADSFQFLTEMKNASDDLNAQIAALEFERRQIGVLDEMAVTAIEVEQAVMHIRRQYEELGKRSSDLDPLIEKIKTMKLENARAAAAFNMSEKIRAQEIAAKQFNDVGANRFIDQYRKDLYEIGLQYDELIRKGTDPRLAGQWRKNAEDLTLLKNRLDTIVDAFEAVGKAFEDAMVQWMESGKFSFKSLIAGLLKELRIYAAQKTARLLMEAAFEGVMSFIDPSGGHAAKAVTALKGAALMGSFVAGSGLAGMAHDGITTIPKDGTWLLKKGERVTDAETNKDLKEFIKNGGTSVVFNANFNNSDEDSVRRMLPQMEQMIVAVVTGNIASGGEVKKAISAYGG